MPPPPPDWGPELDAAFAAGDEQALSAAYRHCAGVIRGLALRALRDDAGADDVVQEVFVVAHRQLSGFRGDAAPSTWLFRITENVVRHRRRRQRRQKPAAVTHCFQARIEDRQHAAVGPVSDQPSESLLQSQDRQRYLVVRKRVTAVRRQRVDVVLAGGTEGALLRADLNWQVLALTFGVTLLTGVLFGLAPAMHATRVAVFPALKGSKIATGPKEAHLGIVFHGKPGTAMAAFGKQLSRSTSPPWSPTSATPGATTRATWSRRSTCWR